MRKAVRPLALLLAGMLLLLGGIACDSDKGTPTGLLAGASPSRSAGVLHTERLTDGVVPPVGSGWSSNQTAVFESRKAFVEYELAAATSIDSIALLADNNDDYLVEAATKGGPYEPLWTAQRSRASGVRWRIVSGLGKTASRLRITPGGGDRALSIAEISVFSATPAQLPPRLTERRAIEGGADYRHALLVFGAAACVALLLSAATAGLGWNLLLSAFALLGFGQMVLVFRDSFPVGELEVSLTRAVSAGVGLAVVAREAFTPKRFPPWKPLSVALLSIAAVMAVGGFFNLGKAQFYDAKAREPSVVHNYDMRVYYPVAKYFDELRYDGLYLASTLAYAEEHGGLDRSQIARTEIRDLGDHRMRRVQDVKSEVVGIRHRFSDARWAAFKKDMAYFWQTMGPGGYLGSMRDHGGNATPVWLSIAHLMFQGTEASNEVLLWSGLLDPLLLLLFAGCAWRAFGLRTALVALIVFGANDFYMFGSNWAGATLRNDWMVYMGLGACALKLERYKLGGALLAFSALIRAFPAIALIALGVPVLYYLLEEWLEKKRLPAPRQIWRDQRWFFDTALGATVFVVVSFVASSTIMGWNSWPLWVQKISSFTASPHVNHISLLTVIAGSEGNQAQVLEARLPVFLVATALYTLLAVWAAYRRPPHVVALLGMMMMPVFMYPANYYIHFVFLLALLVVEPLLAESRLERERAGKVWMLLLGLCAALYFTVKEECLDLHFYNASVLLMVAVFGILILMLPRDEEGLVTVPLASKWWPLLVGSKQSKVQATANEVLEDSTSSENTRDQGKDSVNDGTTEGQDQEGEHG